MVNKYHISGKNGRKWPKLSQNGRHRPREVYADFKVKTQQPPFRELCSSWEAHFGFVASPSGGLKKWCGNFPNFDFSGQ